MHRIVRTAAMPASLALALAFGAGLVTGARADEPGGRDIPPAFSPLEYLVGRWPKGQAMPKDSAQSFRGWSEKHTWAWIFTKGKPTGLSVAIEGGKVLAEGKLTFDAARKRYRLDGTAPKPGGGPIAFEGALDASGRPWSWTRSVPARARRRARAAARSGCRSTPTPISSAIR